MPDSRANLWEETKKSYRGAFAPIRDYWRVYGGVRKLLTSPYAHLALAVTILAGGVWWEQPGWFSLPLAVMPAMMAFTLSGAALVMAVGGHEFHTVLAQAGGSQKPAFLSLTSAFLHFQAVQFIAIFIALVLQGCNQPPTDWLCAQLAGVGIADPETIFYPMRVIAWGLGFFIFIYGLFCGFSATTWIFTVVQLYCKLKRPADAEETTKPLTEERSEEATPPSVTPIVAK